MDRNRLIEDTFKKCDLHVHSSSCWSRSYSEPDFFNQILDSDLDVVAVTDHNSIDVPMLQRLSDLMANKGKTLIAGAELNIKLKDGTIERYGLYVPDGTKGKYFHALVWCSMRNAGELDAAIKELMGGTENIKEAAIFLEDLQERLAQITHFFVPHENKGSRNISDYLPFQDKNGNYHKANDDYKNDLFYYSNSMAVEGGEKSFRRISLAMREEKNTTVSALLFSDAKELSDIGKVYTWIDFDGDLDSLLLAISDPESRIRTSQVSAVVPQRNLGSFLESIEFDLYTSSRGTEHKRLVFAPGYNGIVGSRGSGKSLLAHALTKNDLKDYGAFIRPDSIRFTISGSNRPTSECPRHLYLGQGALESIFKSGEYAAIPFLRERIAPIEDAAREKSQMARNELVETLKEEKRLLTEFARKYPNGTRKLDFLDAAEPDGISLKVPPSIEGDDASQLAEARVAVKTASVGVREAAKKLNGALTSAHYPENAELFSALNNVITAIEVELSATAERLEQLDEILTAGDEAIFATRMKLLNSFMSNIKKFNQQSDAAAKSAYSVSRSEAMKFLEDLLGLRIKLKHLENKASDAYAEMLVSCENTRLSIGSETVEIGFGFKSESSYEELGKSLLKGPAAESNQALVKACLVQSETSKIEALFNRKRIKPDGQSIESWLNVYYEKLQGSIDSSKEPETRVLLNGMPLDQMSPGTRAQALLKIFLNDDIASEGYMYIVLDQPEDNLDVKTIKDFLVERIKELKLDVQFFIVSHSAPVIVNGDARMIVVCQEEGGAITYRQGTLNAEKTKQAIVDVLDGGERYLKMRLNKYNFQVGDER